MSYPRIYSLSTAGVIKHYIHDYLFHAKRTDFVGSNGVGKSVIADLLQMMFVFDKELIKFGTEGLKKEERQIHTLPHQSDYAYCALNIEVKDGLFILIGIQIHNQRNKRIIPFTITRGADLSDELDQIALSKSDLVFATDLLDEGKLPDLQDLAKLLYERKRLKLNFYRNKQDIQDYYKFLYDKHITPLDLTHEKNLKAFAKVIQSFSKAKSLNLSGTQASRSLKDFLFEDTDEDILQNYNREKMELEKIIKEYDQLNTMVEQLGNKQQRLIKLSDLSYTYLRLEKIRRKSEAIDKYHSLSNLRNIEDNGRREKEVNESLQKRLNGILVKLPGLERKIESEYQMADENLQSISTYERIEADLIVVENELADLEVIILPKIDEDWKSHVKVIDVSTRKASDFKASISYCSHFLREYRTWEKVTEARKKQLEIILSMRSKLNDDLQKKTTLLEILEGNSKDNIIHWFLKNLPEVSPEQLQAILYFSTTPISEQVSDKANPRFLNPELLFKDFRFRKTSQGIWIELGAIQEFIKHNPQAELLGTRETLSDSLEKIISDTKADLLHIKEDIRVLGDISDGKSYDTKRFITPFDPAISEQGSIDKLVDAVGVALSLNDKIKSLQHQKKLLDEERFEMSSRFSFEDRDPAVVKRHLQQERSRWEKRQKTFYTSKGEISTKQRTLIDKLKDIEKSIGAVTGQLIQEQKLFDDIIQYYFRDFNENIDEFGTTAGDLSGDSDRSVQAFQQYRHSYLGIVHAFEETKDDKNQQVTMEVKSENFSFEVLERALLGKIKSRDDVTMVLQAANQERIKIADGIRDSMIKIFGRTGERFKRYKSQIQRINTFFVNRKISDKFFFELEFKDSKLADISDVEELAYKVRHSATSGELQFGQSVTEFIEDFFKKISKMREKIPIEKLLDPKTYFELSARLTDVWGKQVPGSTGETYSAIALLGIARLSAVQKEERPGLRFIILEELGSLDEVNFNTFPAIAEQFKYQIITMAPHTFNLGFADEWYAHHLIKGKGEGEINYAPSASFFKTKSASNDLKEYLERMK